jgi:outer membrane protein OmpA-like peptidoglycan-associated protein
VFLSPPLTRDLRISGTPVVELYAALSTAQSNMAALLVDYGAGTQTSRSSEGITTSTTDRTCVGTASAMDTACFRDVSKRLQTLPDATSPWRVTRGALDSANRDSLLTGAPVTIGSQTRFSWPLQPTEHVFKAGHQIGIVITGTFTTLGVAGTTGTVFTVDATVSKVVLPVVGGYRAAAASGGFPDGVAPTLAGVPADVVVAAPDAGGVAVQYTPPTATDNETPDVQVECTPASGSVFPIGATTVTCAALDGQGNRGEASFRVTVTAPAEPPTPPPATTVGLGRRLLVVSARARRLDVPCTLDRPLLARCSVALVAGGKTLARGTADAPAGSASATVALPLTAATVRLARRADGLVATLRATAEQTGGGALAAGVKVLLLPTSTLTLPSDALFRGGASTLPANGTASLRSLRDLLTGARRITCTGHTDDRGAASANQRLGLARARSVCAFLTDGTAIAGRAASRGESAPRASNRSAAGRAANRRVTVTFEY